MKLTSFLVAMIIAASPGALGAQDVTRPEVIRFGASLPDMEAALAGLCDMRRTRVIDPPFLREVREIQHQIDCDGFQYMGRGRRAEFVFRDRILQMVWILVTAEEQEAIVAAMRRAYRAPGRSVPRFVAFPEARTAWRFRPPEVLFYSVDLAAQVERWFEE